MITCFIFSMNHSEDDLIVVDFAKKTLLQLLRKVELVFSWPRPVFFLYTYLSLLFMSEKLISGSL